MSPPETLPLRSASSSIRCRWLQNSIGRPGSLLGVLEAVQEQNRHKYLPRTLSLRRSQDGNTAFADLQRRDLLRPLQSCSPRARTPSAFAEVPRAIPGAHATCCKALASNSDSAWTRNEENEADKLLLTTPDHSSPCVPSPASDNARWRRRRSEPSHLRTCHRAHVATGNRTIRAGE